MATFANMSLTDGQATPVTHVFYATRTEADGTRIWEDWDHSQYPAGWYRVTCRLDFDKGSRRTRVGQSVQGTNKVVVKVEMPVLTTQTGVTDNGAIIVPMLSYKLASIHTFYLPSQSSTAQRADLRAFSVAALKNGQVAAMIDGLQGITG